MPRRPQRRRQVDAAHGSRRTDRPRWRRAVPAAGHARRLHAAGTGIRCEPDGGRVRRAGPACPIPSTPIVAISSRRLWTRSAWARSAARPTFPVAKADGSALRRRSLPSPISCCSMSRPTISIFRRSNGSRSASPRLPGGLLLVSHDRSFLKRLSRRTLWLDRGRLYELDQGYEAFEAWSEGVLAAEAAEQARLDKRIASETVWLRQGISARRRRNQGRVRRLAEMRRRAGRAGRPAPGQARHGGGGDRRPPCHRVGACGQVVRRPDRARR